MPDNLPMLDYAKPRPLAYKRQYPLTDVVLWAAFGLGAFVASAIIFQVLAECLYIRK